MGGREVGGLANLLSGHRDLANPAAPRRSGRAVGRAERARQARQDRGGDVPGRRRRRNQGAVDRLHQPGAELPDQATVRRALQRAEFVVVQEAFATTATCAYADLLLPATTWGEKDGTVTNSERRISRVRAVAVPAARRGPPRLADCHRFRAAAGGALGPSWGPGQDATAALFPYDSPERSGTNTANPPVARDLDITGLSYAMLEARRRSNGRCPKAPPAGARLYEDGVFPTPDGRARFCRRAASPWPNRATRATRFQPDHRAPARPVARHEPHRHAGPPVRPCCG
jgi:assimilatory nitrate reductase catalytic subunit